MAAELLIGRGFGFQQQRQGIAGQAEGSRWKQFIPIAAGGKRAWFPHQRPDHMMVINAVPIFSNEPGEREHLGGAHISLDRF